MDEEGEKMEKNIGVISSHGLVGIHKREPIEHAYSVMKRISTRHLPVIDDDGTIVGMLSDRDFKRAMKVPDSRKWLATDREPEFDPNEIAMEYMSWPIQTIDESTAISKAAEKMIENKISSLIVTRNRQAVGVVTTEDLLKALIKENKESEPTLKENIKASIYSSPVGNIAQLLSNIGI
jgi:acetoin utilization protein AcuB